MSLRARVETARIGPVPRSKRSGAPSASSWKKCTLPAGQLCPFTRMRQPHESTGRQTSVGTTGSAAAGRATMAAATRSGARQRGINESKGSRIKGPAPRGLFESLSLLFPLKINAKLTPFVVLAANLVVSHGNKFFD